MSKLALLQSLPLGSRHLVSLLWLQLELKGNIRGDNCYFQHAALFQTLGWSIFCYSRTLKETRQSGKLNLWTKHVDTKCYTINLREWHVLCHYQRKSGLHMFFSFSSSNNPSDLQSFMQVKEDSTTKNRNMSYANFKKATLHSCSR